MRILFVYIVVCVFNCAYAQNKIIPSTFRFDLLTINPAYSGSLNLFSASVLHKKKWINIKGAPTYFQASINSPFLNETIGLGAFFSKETFSIREETSAFVSYAYKMYTRSGLLALGLSTGVKNLNINYSNLELLNENDPLLSGEINIFNYNFGLGIYFANPLFFVGFSIPQIVENKLLFLDSSISSSEILSEARSYNLNAGVIYPISSFIKLSPSALLTIYEEFPLEWDIATNIIFKDIIYFGVGYKNTNEFVFTLFMEVNRFIKVGYAYDTPVYNDLLKNSQGTHEIVLTFRKKLKYDFGDDLCPSYY